MKINLTNRAKDKGILEMKIMKEKEHEEFISCVIYQKIDKNGEVFEVLEPAVIFKDNEIKSKNYDQAKRLAEDVGYVELLPDLNFFKTDYYGINFNGYTNVLKSWGYNSNHVPQRKIWKKEDFEIKSSEWLEDTYNMGLMIVNLIKIYNSNPSPEIQIEKAIHWLKQNNYKLY